MFTVRKNVKTDFPIIHDFGIENLIVSGASFTHNNSEEHACAWPYYLKALGNFHEVLDCSMPGAGNYHVAHSLQWNLTMHKVDPAASIVIVMWTDNTSDDTICAEEHLSKYPFRHHYTESVCTAISGGIHPQAMGNTLDGLKQVSNIKNNSSRSIENFLYITGLWAWLKHRGYKTVFLDYADKKIPSRSFDFSIRKYLPAQAKAELDRIMTKHHNLYNYAVKNDLLYVDDYHPSSDGHLKWTGEILVPLLKSLSI